MKHKVLNILLVLSVIVGLLSFTALVRAQEPPEEAPVEGEAGVLPTPTVQLTEAPAAEEAEETADVPVAEAPAEEPVIEETEATADVPVAESPAEEPVIEEAEGAADIPVAGAPAEEPAAEEPEQIAAAPAGETVSIEASAEEQEAALAMWTRDARRAARPLSFIGGPFEAAEVGDEDMGAVEPGFSASGKPDPNADKMAQQQFAEEWALAEDLAAADEVEEFGTAGVYTSYITNFYTPQLHLLFPYRPVGKLYIAGGGYCSASVISGNNIIVTAAHCVYDTDANKWKSGWTFVPADRNGAAPYGTFAWSSARVLNNWINAANSTAGRRYDVALIKLRNNSAGRSVTSYVGWLGRLWNASYVQLLHAMGYPSNLTNGTKYTYSCEAEGFSYAADIIGMGCNMMHGSSGGPWIVAFRPYQWGAMNYVNSVVSGGYYGATWGNTFYGARFSSSNIVPLCTAMGC